jgi:hypothetical protein
LIQAQLHTHKRVELPAVVQAGSKKESIERGRKRTVVAVGGRFCWISNPRAQLVLAQISSLRGMRSEARACDSLWLEHGVVMVSSPDDRGRAKPASRNASNWASRNGGKTGDESSDASGHG